jgi:RND family efflux transporter MFP subunit
MDMQVSTKTEALTQRLSPRGQGQRLWITIGIALVAAILGIVGTWAVLSDGGSGEAAAATAAKPVPALTVTVAAPERVQWATTIQAPGAIAPWQEASISAQVAGVRLLDVNVNVGDEVKRDQLLARFDTETLRAELAELVASQVETQSTLAEAQANRERALKMKGSGAMSEQDILQYVTRAETAQAQLASAQARVASKRLQVHYAHIVAPDDGVISARSATVGAVGQVGQELFRLIRQGRLEWRGELTAQQVSQIVAGQQVALILPDGGTATARVRQTAPMMDSQSRLAIVYADIEPGSAARAGMYADGKVTLAQSTALSIPAASVVIRDGRSYVLKVQSAGEAPRVALQAVSVGRRKNDRVEIAKGLQEQDRVVVQGAGFLNDGDVVRIASSPVSGV